MFQTTSLTTLAILLVLGTSSGIPTAAFGPTTDIPWTSTLDETMANHVTVDLSSPMPMRDFLKLYAEKSGRKIFIPHEESHVNQYSVIGFGSMSFPKEEIDAFFQSVLALNGLKLDLVGPSTMSMYRLGPATRSLPATQAQSVSMESLEAALNRPAELISVSMPLKHISAHSAIRFHEDTGGNSNGRSPARKGSRVISAGTRDNNVLVLIGFPSEVRHIVELIQQIDLPSPASAPQEGANNDGKEKPGADKK